jgi:hypothetical protein
MSEDTGTGAGMREQVRAKYAGAALAVLGQADGGDKPAVLAEMFRVLVPGGRIGISDVVAEDHMSAADRTAAGSYVGCIAGALSKSEYLAGLAAAGFTGASVTFTHEAAPGMHSAIIRAAKPSA